MEMINIIVDTFGVLALLAGIGLGLKKFYEFLRNNMQGRPSGRAVLARAGGCYGWGAGVARQGRNIKSKQLERARFVKDVRAEVRRYLEELQK